MNDTRCFAYDVDSIVTRPAMFFDIHQVVIKEKDSNKRGHRAPCTMHHRDHVDPNQSIQSAHGAQQGQVFCQRQCRMGVRGMHACMHAWLAGWLAGSRGERQKAGSFTRVH